jgi:hypothetical protein
MRNRYVWNTTVRNVHRKETTVSGKIGADGMAELTVESAGWYIQIGYISLYAGEEEPPYKSGDTVRLTLELIGANEDAG